MIEESYVIRKSTVYYLEHTIRHKSSYKDNNGKTHIITPPVLPRIIPKGKFGDEVWIDILIDKYQQHIPIQRQLFPAHQENVNFHASTIFNGLKYLYLKYLKCLQECFISSIQDASHWHADETRWYMLNDLNKKLWYMWGFKSENITLFILDSTRSATVPAKTLFGIQDIHSMESYTEIEQDKLKILNVDRFSSYKLLERLGLVRLSFCWAHVRRDFTDTIKKYPKYLDLKEWADSCLLKIAKIYSINKERVLFFENNNQEKFETSDMKLKEAIEDIKTLMLDEIEKGKQELEKLEENETLDIETEVRYKIMSSMNNHFEGLTIFIENPKIPMDNNKMENGIRPIALGRNNYRGTQSDWGGELSALMYSIIETCKQNNINPKAYLEFYFDACIKDEVHENKKLLENFLPFNISNKEKEKFNLVLKKY